MNVQPLALATFKQYWFEMAAQYPVNNNDAALIFRAITDVLVLLHKQSHGVAERTLDDCVERIAASFPEAIAPLYRDLAKICIQA
ncbi:hypothetical protein H6G89_05655 [Oscillatoria sp. FACHB-1407]|uniref:hypothetical protein n=1 Tax=Oscillatoria sp. FACHB-1407 TaxID=2692847 RepID=UPI0016886E67|nr:hypothetical protein [Oscillatoria sp. FACHB-1407]MBD2460526.1 hypothetical protein [Oscillatoria sp. FACHB-1407]